MKLIVNQKELDSNTKTLFDLSLELRLAEKGVAVAVDSRMIPRALWPEFELKEGQKITILKAFSGG